MDSTGLRNLFVGNSWAGKSINTVQSSILEVSI